MRWRLITAAALICAASAAIALWVLHAPLFGHWLQVHTGTVNESGPYYGFWSGFGSDLEEFGILGGIAAGIYQLVKKHNCHEPGCWRVGQYPAADGQFMLCYRHHPDYRAGSRLTSSSNGCTVSTWNARRRSTASSTRPITTGLPAGPRLTTRPVTCGTVRRGPAPPRHPT